MPMVFTLNACCSMYAVSMSIKQQSIFQWSQKQKHHITFLQESYSSKDFEFIWEREWDGKVFFSHGTNLKKDVITLINTSVDFRVEKCIPDQQGRFITFKCYLKKTLLFLLTSMHQMTSPSKSLSSIN